MASKMMDKHAACKRRVVETVQVSTLGAGSLRNLDNAGETSVKYGWGMGIVFNFMFG